MNPEQHRLSTVLLALAGLVGAGGVVAGAAAAHVTGTESLRTAAEILMIHAVAAVGVVALAAQRTRPSAWLYVAAAMVTGAALFGGDIAVRAATGSAIFPMAAPTGGTILILAWLALVGVAIWDRSGGA